MFPKYFMYNLGANMLFRTLSSGLIYETTSSNRLTPKRKDQELCSKIINSEEGLNYFIEYFNLTEFYDGDVLKNMFKFYLKKRFDKR